MKLHALSIPYRTAEGGSKTAGVVVAFVALVTPLASLTNPFYTMALGAIPGYVLSALWQTVYYTRYRYELTEDALTIRSGVISRRVVEIPVNRIQNIDVTHGYIQRLLGIAEVRVETAGDTQDANIRVLGKDEALELRRAVEDTDETDNDDRTLFTLKLRELGILSFFSIDFTALALILSVFSLLPVFNIDTVTVIKSLINFSSPSTALIAVLVLSFAVWFSGALEKFTRYSRFHLKYSGDTLYYSHGLLRKHESSIPLRKIQTVTIKEPLLARLLGYASLSIQTAGYAPNEEGESQVMVPLAKRRRVRVLAREIHDYGDKELIPLPRKARRRYITRYLAIILALTALLWLVSVEFGVLNPGSFAWYVPLAYLPIAPAAAHMKWSSRGYSLRNDCMVTRKGYWTRETRIVPLHRVQNVIQTRNPFQRRLGLASLTIDTAGSYESAVATDIETETADALLIDVNRGLYNTLAENHRKTDNNPRIGVDTG